MYPLFHFKEVMLTYCLYICKSFIGLHISSNFLSQNNSKVDVHKINDHVEDVAHLIWWSTNNRSNAQYTY